MPPDTNSGHTTITGHLEVLVPQHYQLSGEITTAIICFQILRGTYLNEFSLIYARNIYHISLFTKKQLKFFMSFIFYWICLIYTY